MVQIDELLRDLVARDASDLHLKANNPPMMRIRGDIIRTDYPVFSAEQLTSFLLGILTEERKQKLYEYKELDLSYFVQGLARFRVNMYWQRGHIGAVFRVIPYKIRTIDELEMPQVTKQLEA